jgi:outer membrane protein assembly factor BamB
MRVATVIFCSILLVSVGCVTLNAQTPPVSVTPLNILTFHNTNQRLGLNALETTLTPANVNPATFGKVNFLSTDGIVYGEPLYVSNVPINGVIHNVVYVATENDSVYAFDADNGTQLWRVTALLPNEVPAKYLNCGLINPIGITGTPVIDLTTGGHGLIYVVAASLDQNQVYHQRLHAFDLTTGGEGVGGPTEITGQYPGTGDNSQNGFVIFDPAQYLERAALLEVNHKIYIAFSSHCDERPYTGWVMQYSAWTLQQLSVLDLTPNGYQAAIWQSGGGPAADSDGNIYLLAGNGVFDTTLDGSGFPINGDYGNALVKISGNTSSMTVLDYFTMYNTLDETDQDLDFGSGGPIVLDIPSASPNQPPVPVVIASGKDTNIYVANRYSMGKWNQTNDSALYQELDGVVNYGLFGTPAVFNNTIYYGPENGHITAYRISKGYISTTPSSQSVTMFGSRGATPSISSNGFSNGIVWANSWSKTDYGVLHAYDAQDLRQELYNSNLAGQRDQYGLSTRMTAPLIANGRVYVPTPLGVAVFGLLGSSEHGNRH